MELSELDFYDVIKTRRSIRKFKPEQPPIETVKKILKAAILSPSWANSQRVRYIVVTEPELVKQIINSTGQAKMGFNTAPMVIVACAYTKSAGNRTDKQMFLVDVGIGFEHLILAATVEGLATCWMGFFSESKIKKLLNIPDDLRVIALTPLGYADETPHKQRRKKFEQIVYFNNFGEPLSS